MNECQLHGLDVKTHVCPRTFNIVLTIFPVMNIRRYLWKFWACVETLRVELD